MYTSVPNAKLCIIGPKCVTSTPESSSSRLLHVISTRWRGIRHLEVLLYASSIRKQVSTVKFFRIVKSGYMTIRNSFTSCINNGRRDVETKMSSSLHLVQCLSFQRALSALAKLYLVLTTELLNSGWPR